MREWRAMKVTIAQATLILKVQTTNQQQMGVVKDFYVAVVVNKDKRKVKTVMTQQDLSKCQQT